MDGRVVIELQDVTFGYDARRTALEVPSLTIPAGVTLVVGQNGSGKSTLLRLIAGVDPPSRGTIRIDSLDLWRDEVEARRKLAYVPETPELTPYATIADVLQLVASLRGAAMESVVNALDRVGLFELAGRTVRELSMGQRRRAMLASALVGDPRVIILDEPLETLDVEMRAFIVEWVASLRVAGAAVLVATHDVASFTAVTDRTLAVDAGRVRWRPGS